MENRKNAITNVKLVFLAQVFVVIVSIIRSLLVPKIITVEEHGYWQTYLLYVSYISIFFLGFNDGVYLKCVGWKDDRYKSQSFASAYKMFALLLLFETFLVSTVLILLNVRYLNIYLLVALNIPEMGLLGTTSYYYQLAGKMKSYTISVVASKAVFLLVLAVMYLTGTLSAQGLMWTDFAASLIVLIVIVIKEKDIFVFGNRGIVNSIKDMAQYIGTGFSVMLGSYIALLFGGIGRIFIQNTASIEEFSYYSFALSISNIIILCFGSMGLAVYPEIARAGTENFGRYYLKIEKMIDNFAPIMLFCYYPAYVFIKYFIPKYLPTMQFLGLTFIIVVLQLKINVLNNTYYKLLRLEKRMLIDNIISLIQMLIGCFIFQKTIPILFCQIGVMLYRVYRTRYLFSKELSIKKNNIALEVLVILAFVTCLQFKLIGFVGYTLICALLCIYNWRELREDIGLFIKRRKK